MSKILKEHLDIIKNSISLLIKNNNYGCGGVISFCIISEKYPKYEEFKYKNYNIIINPTKDELYGVNIHTAIIEEAYPVDFDTNDRIDSIIISRFNRHGIKKYI